MPRDKLSPEEQAGETEIKVPRDHDKIFESQLVKKNQTILTGTSTIKNNIACATFVQLTMNKTIKNADKHKCIVIFFCGAEGSRTPVRKHIHTGISERSHLFKIPSAARQVTAHTVLVASFVMHSAKLNYVTFTTV